MHALSLLKFFIKHFLVNVFVVKLVPLCVLYDMLPLIGVRGEGGRVLVGVRGEDGRVLVGVRDEDRRVRVGGC